MLVPILLFALGLLCLIKGGDWFVDGASGIARRFRLPELLIGATVVSIGTTLPEVMVSATSALQGHAEISYGNAIGSIICNTALIAAIPMLVRPGAIRKKTLILPVAFFFIAAAFYTGTAYITGEFTRLSGVILLGLFLVYMVLSVLTMKHGGGDDGAEEEEIAEENDATSASGLRAAIAKYNAFKGRHELIFFLVDLVVGAALIALGATLLVDNGTIIARELGVPESVIALTFVALGTSLPELVTAITALVKGHNALSVGNVIGANLFDLVLVSGLSVTLAPFSVPETSKLFGYNASLVMEIPLMFLAMLLLCVPALIRGKLSRVQGGILLLLYAAFCVVQFTLCKAV